MIDDCLPSAMGDTIVNYHWPNPNTHHSLSVFWHMNQLNSCWQECLEVFVSNALLHIILLYYLQLTFTSLCFVLITIINPPNKWVTYVGYGNS